MAPPAKKAASARKSSPPRAPVRRVTKPLTAAERRNRDAEGETLAFGGAMDKAKISYPKKTVRKSGQRGTR